MHRSALAERRTARHRQRIVSCPISVSSLPLTSIIFSGACPFCLGICPCQPCTRQRSTILAKLKVKDPQALSPASVLAIGLVDGLANQIDSMRLPKPCRLPSHTHRQLSFLRTSGSCFRGGPSPILSSHPASLAPPLEVTDLYI